MSEQMSLEVQARKGTGKGFNRRLRSEGFVPGVYYDAKGKNVAVQVLRIPLEKIFSKVKTSRVFDLQINDGGAAEKKPVLIKEVHYHPVKSRIDHIDFYGVDLTLELKIQVPVEVVGKHKGAIDGGVLEIYRDMIEVSCLPTAIPESVVIDVSELGINQNVSIRDVKLPEGVKAVFEESFAVVGVSAPSGAEEKAAGEAGAGEGEGA